MTCYVIGRLIYNRPIGESFMEALENLGAYLESSAKSYDINISED